MNDSIQKVIDLIKKTGDKIIVFDNKDQEKSYVIMKLEDYEKLALNNQVRGLTEKELLDKINRDIAIWKSQENFFEDELDFEDEDEDLYERKSWTIPHERKKGAEEVVDKEQYLEELPF